MSGYKPPRLAAYAALAYPVSIFDYKSIWIDNFYLVNGISTLSFNSPVAVTVPTWS